MAQPVEILQLNLMHFCASPPSYVLQHCDAWCRSPEDCPQEIATIVERCMEAEPDKRPTTLELFECLSSHSLPAGRALSERQL